MAKELAKQYDPSEVEDRTISFGVIKSIFTLKEKKAKRLIQ